MKKIKTAGLFLMLLFVTTLNAQLSNFSLNVSKTDETCLGNGSLTLSVSNTSANASILYKIYKLPNVTNAIFISSDNYMGGLSAGNYKVIALQSLGSNQNSKEQTVTVENKRVDFNFTVSSTNQSCSAGGTITVRATTGIVARCEIVKGPEKRELQTSNVFANLPGGTYNIRAYDECGNGKVKTYTLSLINSVLTISNPTYPDVVNKICDSIRVNNSIAPSSGSINYPISVTHTLTPMDLGGNSIVINQVFETGQANLQVVSAVLPRLDGQTYTYDVTVTDNCNTVYSKEDNVVDPNILLKLSAGEAKCAEKFLIINASKYTTSYKVNFISTPAGFDLSKYTTNADAFYTEPTTTFGSRDNSVPFGIYEIEIVDQCGRAVTQTINIEFIKPKPAGSGYNNGCFSDFGGISISVPQQKLVKAVMTSAPDTYTINHTMPMEVTAKINAQGILRLIDLPLGEYKFDIGDDCTFDYNQVKVIVPEYIDKKFNISALPACGPGFGTVRYRSGNGKLTSASIVDAPAAYKGAKDVTSNLSTEGALYMDNLPEGSYVFQGVDICGVDVSFPIDIEGYVPSQKTFTFTPNCGGFAVKVTDESNGVEGATYFLQKFNTTTNTWGHPGTGKAYAEWSVPGDDTGVKLSNNTVRNNLNYSGKFRIVKKFESYGNATSKNTMCVSAYGEPFEYTEQFAIKAAYSLACMGTPNDVMLDVVGYPTSFKITEKDGKAFTIDNGTDNVFKNLEPAEYKFVIEDNCGNIVPKWFDVQTLPSISDARQPNDMVFCTDDTSVKNYQFHLTDQNETILGPLYSSMYTISYHLSQEDADAGANSLPEFYTSKVNGQVIYARLINNEVSLCHGTTSFKLFVGGAQEPTVSTEGTICDGKKIALIAAGGYDSYLWSNGETTKTIYVTEPGLYSVTVNKNFGNSFCSKYAEVEVHESFTPNIKNIETEDWTDHDNTITVNTDNPGTYEYSIDGMNYQAENTFAGLDSGVYKVYVKDINGCGQDIKEVVLLNYPNYFTPNGDGHHDKWYIKYSVKEPHINVVIFDRYGKLITTLGPTSDGWDGTLNGIQLPSTDYWFVVTREDGRELKGHFSMLR